LVRLHKLTEFEKSTPLAFAIVVHGSLGQLEALLASIFRPQNIYCLYVDPKASAKIKAGVKKLADNYKSAFKQVCTYVCTYIPASILHTKHTRVSKFLHM
jgi:hypothetical protein